MFAVRHLLVRYYNFTRKLQLYAILAVYLFFFFLIGHIVLIVSFKSSRVNWYVISATYITISVFDIVYKQHSFCGYKNCFSLNCIL